ncbi:phage baseplate protein [Paenibacillus tyrfis]|uniref:Dit-like phage tail protein N-terminal domain-containing protein n=1 Tax=Paenibacillus tyrfis TaxID=1501230 RepID=A0A081NWQ6_9BACL|nr:hypothetical protein [Paenibacillus tyrfis]KEQ22879.1 hypothetical protein ET33_21280 [Paenibacillus tyrfis]
MATLDGRYILVEVEDPSHEVNVTEQPVEDNVNLTDHVQLKASSMSISGYIIGDDAAQIKQYLIDAMKAGSIVEYDGRNLFVGLITSISTKHDHRVANGFSFSMTLKEISIAEASYVETLPLPIKAQVAPVISSGRKQTKGKGKGKGKEKEEVQKVKFKAGSPWAE